jgi:hypothetical protein
MQKENTICPTSLFNYIKDVAGKLHGHQIKAIAAVVFAIIEQRTAVQATLAEVLGNQEAACRRITRLLHNPRLPPKELSDLKAGHILSSVAETEFNTASQAIIQTLVAF